MPLISDDWTDHFRWNGKGDMPGEEYEKLKGMVEKAHVKGRSIRFWALPNKTRDQRVRVWQALIDAGVDYMGADNLAELAEFVGKVQK